MARPMTTTAVGRVNRRFLFLALILAVLSAVLVYAAVTKSGGGETASGETPVLVATEDIEAGTEITEGMLELDDFADNQVPSGALDSTEAAVGLIAKETIVAREAVLASSVVDTTTPIDENVLSYVIEGTRRGMAIESVQVVGAGGLVLPGDHVDVFWVPEKPVDDVEGALLLAENVEVLAVQQAVLDIGPTAPGVTEDGEEPANAPGTNDRSRSQVEQPVPEAITVTLMLTPDQVSRVFCGDEAGALRLAVRAFGDNGPNGQPVSDCIIVGEGRPNE
jgi:pilus assembly protein CpaB